MGNNVNAAYAPVLRTAGYHQTSNGLLWLAPGIVSRGTDGSTSVQRSGAIIRSFELENRSGGVAACGIGFRLANRSWIMGRYNAAGTTFTDLTSTAQSTSSVTLQVTGADQTGFVIGCRYKFDWVSVNITTAETNPAGDVAHTVAYSNLAGTGFTTMTANTPVTDGFTLTNTAYAAAVTNFVWQSPEAWGAWTSTVLPQGYFYLRFTSVGRDAGDVAAIATGIEIGIGKFREGVDDNTIYASEKESFFHPEADGLIAYFSTANAGNYVQADVAPWG
jgi:hypothetical protein